MLSMEVHSQRGAIMPLKKAPAKTLPVPQTIEEAAEAQRKISELMRNIYEFENQFEHQREDIDRREEAAIFPLRQEILALARTIYAFAKQNRSELTQDGKKKTVSLPGKAGSLQWYMPPPSVDISKVDEVLARIKTLDLKQFIRTKEEIDKRALLSEADLAQTIEGVSISQNEKFVVKPKGTRERLECNTKTKRWKFTPLDS